MISRCRVILIWIFAGLGGGQLIGRAAPPPPDPIRWRVEGQGGAMVLEDRKKLIELGWDIPTTAFLKSNWMSMETNTPFDGVIFKAEGRDADERRSWSTLALWDNQPWPQERLATALADLRGCGFIRFQSNFLRINASPGDLSWADDAGWAVFVDKITLCARLSKEGGCKGLALDFESYGAKQFRFDPGQGRAFAEAGVLARRRGRQFMQAIAGPFPSAVLLALRLNSANLQAGHSDDPPAVLVAGDYGLLAPFIDGMLDQLPPAMTLVDGCEEGYFMDSAEEFFRAAAQIRSWSGPAIALVSPENRAKYRQQVQVGFGFYLDLFLNEPGSKYYSPPLNGSRLARLRRNLAFARAATDEYVWVDGEQCRWWDRPVSAPHSVGKGQHWEKAMPGLNRALAHTFHPEQAALKQFATGSATGTWTNLAINGDFSERATNSLRILPRGYSTWERVNEPRAEFAWDGRVGNGSARLSRVKEGCFVQVISVMEGEAYAVGVASLPQGDSFPTLLLRWQTGEGKWTHTARDRTLPFKPATGDWQVAWGVVPVPLGAGKMVVLLSVAGQHADTDVCWFDNLRIYHLPERSF